MSYFIIGGTEKAGTTSVFEYLAMHPGVRPSQRKETDYFRQPNCSEQGYRALFSPGSADQVCMEASPGYLGLARDVAPRIDATLSGCRLLFILRDPVERLQSSYRFHRSRFFIPQWLGIDDYVQLCMAYDEGRIALADTPFDNSWFLDVLPAGRYAEHLQHYFDHFGDRVMLLDFDQLNREPDTVMQRIAGALDLDAGFYRDFEFFRANATFQGKHHWLHARSMKLNHCLEPLLRRYPRLKRRIVALYRRVNGAGLPEDSTLSQTSVNQLRDYYARDVERVRQLLRATGTPTIHWRHFHAA
ncbi:sulfotransferase domain-containing protein [Parahaliea aestuarii]|uniref:Sulfotransferase domain-containing protein n=1 Tax=Parahaliea aestuarii TaxID=1852021 RepID=A0A5C8ZQ50_9GAMM|nr:sulfotransferase domain-containing protein [Parahaliea aestuarii]TXS90465.1 sulfotransferase domain-containing protein [Parahaliea aestuarii]